MRNRELVVRSAAALLLVFATGAFVASRTSFEHVPTSASLELFPRRFEAWEARDNKIDPKVRETLGNGQFLSREYISPGETPIDLFIAYYPSQRTGSTPHSPQHCLPGAGWQFSNFQIVDAPLATGGSFRTREYVITRGSDRALVFYWYQSHGRTITSDYSAKLYLFADAIRFNRTDGALVRVLTPLRNGEAVELGRRRLTTFVGSMVLSLDRYIPK